MEDQQGSDVTCGIKILRPISNLNNSTMSYINCTQIKEELADHLHEATSSTVVSNHTGYCNNNIKSLS